MAAVNARLPLKSYLKNEFVLLSVQVPHPISRKVTQEAACGIGVSGRDRPLQLVLLVYWFLDRNPVRWMVEEALCARRTVSVW